MGKKFERFFDNNSFGILGDEDFGKDFVVHDHDPAEASRQCINNLKFGFLMAICRAPEGSLVCDDLDLGWQMLSDEAVLERLEKEGVRKEAESCKKAGQEHWYLSRLNLGNAVEGDLMVMVGMHD